jgi:hypothetical protein
MNVWTCIAPAPRSPSSMLPRSSSAPASWPTTRPSRSRSLAPLRRAPRSPSRPPTAGEEVVEFAHGHPRCCGAAGECGNGHPGPSSSGSSSASRASLDAGRSTARDRMAQPAAVNPTPKSRVPSGGPDGAWRPTLVITDCANSVSGTLVLDASTSDEPVNLSDSHPKPPQHWSPADANQCQSLLCDPNAMIRIDLHQRLSLLVTGRGEYPGFSLPWICSAD